jgi:dipeptidyl aminopeptidase/acylaminoacyl peptidase
MSRPLAIIISAIVVSFGGIHAQTIERISGDKAPQSSKAPWTTDDVVMAEQASGFQISPDNQWAVWVKSTPDKEGDKVVSNLILSSLIDGKEVQLTRAGGSSPKWSPDGQLIAFLTGRNSPGLPQGGRNGAIVVDQPVRRRAVAGEWLQSCGFRLRLG